MKSDPIEVNFTALHNRFHLWALIQMVYLTAIACSLALVFTSKAYLLSSAAMLIGYYFWQQTIGQRMVALVRCLLVEQLPGIATLKSNPFPLPIFAKMEKLVITGEASWLNAYGILDSIATHGRKITNSN